MNIYTYSYNLRTRRIGWTAGRLPRRADLCVLIERLVPRNAASVLSRPASGCPGAGRTGVRPAVRRAPDPGRSHIHRASLLAAPSAASGPHTLPARRASFSLPVPPGNMCPLSGRRDGNAQNPVRDRLFCPGRDFLTPSSPAAPSRRTPAPSDTPGPAPPLSGWCRRGGPSWRTPPPPRSRSSASGRSPASGSC